MRDAFESNGVPVHFSIYDNDDTLASHAWKDKAEIMSRDKDFYRYQYKGKVVFKTTLRLKDLSPGEFQLEKVNLNYRRHGKYHSPQSSHKRKIEPREIEHNIKTSRCRN